MRSISPGRDPGDRPLTIVTPAHVGHEHERVRTAASRSGTIGAMLECQGCHRFIRASESSCPFCGVPSTLTSATSVGSLQLAFAAGLSMLACDSGEDSGDTNAVTTDQSSSETSETSTSGDGDGDTQETLDYSGSDYGGAPPCEELQTAIPIAVGSNPIDTSMAGNDHGSYCGDLQGTGPDDILEFSAPADGHFTFTPTANFDAWLLESGYYCYPYGGNECAAGQALEIDMLEGQILYLMLDGASDAGGTVTIEVSQA